MEQETQKQPGLRAEIPERRWEKEGNDEAGLAHWEAAWPRHALPALLWGSLAPGRWGSAALEITCLVVRSFILLSWKPDPVSRLIFQTRS